MSLDFAQSLMRNSHIGKRSSFTLSTEQALESSVESYQWIVLDWSKALSSAANARVNDDMQNAA